MRETFDQISQLTPGRYRRRRIRRRTFITTTRRTRNKRRPREILPMFDAILVMKRDILQVTIPSGKQDDMIILKNTMNQQTKNSEERRMIRIKSMC